MIFLKRFAAVCLAVLLLLCHLAGAENAGLIQSDFEDFILSTENALTYRGEKTEGMPVFAFTSSTAGIATSAVNAVWSSEQAQLTPEQFTAGIRNIEDSVRAQYEAGGYTLLSFDVEDAVETEYWGQPVLLCDAELLVSINDTETVLVRRTLRITGSYGSYLFSLSAWSHEDLEAATDTLVQAVRWK